MEVTEGFLVYTRSRNKVVPVEISPQAKQLVKAAVQEMVVVTNENIFPKATKSKKRCATCTHRNVCPQ
ncbi:protein of unknown function DUF83, putative [Microscilla marina ATCC 23134]|uniref:DUF83 domain-containing protein n=1 Tax=Microscilla marina ATCC 23134 TaxID=313606 RepID=A1ZJB2_MICM2|nr:protein of unknown function DUF83, putative [Microscilla marina ATCC 23134]